MNAIEKHIKDEEKEHLKEIRHEDTCNIKTENKKSRRLDKIQY